MTSEFKNYRVTMRKQHPAWDERDGIASEQQARSKRDAIRYARREMENAGHCGFGQGRVWFKAEELPDAV